MCRDISAGKEDTVYNLYGYLNTGFLSARSMRVFNQQGWAATNRTTIQGHSGSLRVKIIFLSYRRIVKTP